MQRCDFSHYSSIEFDLAPGQITNTRYRDHQGIDEKAESISSSANRNCGGILHCIVSIEAEFRHDWYLAPNANIT